LAKAPPDSSRNLIVWIVVPLVLIVVANSLVFVVYQGANPGEDWYSQAWGFLQSQPFLAITGSLLFPIAIFLVENRLQIIQKRSDERKELRVKCLQRTEEVWGQLQSLAFTVSTCDAGTSPKRDVLKILGTVHDFKNSGEQLISEWMLRFPDLDSRTLEDVLALIDVVSDPTYAIAYRLLDAPGDPTTRELQGHLGAIADVVDGVVRYAIVEVFSLTIEIGDPATGRRERRQKEERRAVRLASVHAWADGVRAVRRRFINVGPFSTGQGVDGLRAAFLEIEGEMAARKQTAVSADEFAKLSAAYDGLTPQERTDVLRYGINGTSVDLVRETSAWLSTQWLRIEVEGRLAPGTDGAGRSPDQG
jgi:hypothetical protein